MKNVYLFTFFLHMFASLSESFYLFSCIHYDLVECILTRNLNDMNFVNNRRHFVSSTSKKASIFLIKNMQIN